MRTVRGRYGPVCGAHILLVFYKDDLIVIDAAPNGVLAAYFINYLYFFLVNMINWWGFTLDRLKKRGLRHVSGSKKGGLMHGSDSGGGGGGGEWGVLLLGMGQAYKYTGGGIVPRHIKKGGS